VTRMLEPPPTAPEQQFEGQHCDGQSHKGCAGHRLHSRSFVAKGVGPLRLPPNEAKGGLEGRRRCDPPQAAKLSVAYVVQPIPGIDVAYDAARVGWPDWSRTDGARRLSAPDRTHAHRGIQAVDIRAASPTTRQRKEHFGRKRNCARMALIVAAVSSPPSEGS